MQDTTRGVDGKIGLKNDQPDDSDPLLHLLFLLPQSWITEGVYDKILAICHRIIVSSKKRDDDHYDDSDSNNRCGWIIPRHEFI